MAVPCCAPGPHTQSTKARLKPSLGGVKFLERFLGLRGDAIISTDAVFISLDLEVASDRKFLSSSGEQPVITQLGFARLDTRHLSSLSEENDLHSFLSVRFYNVEGQSLSKSARNKKKRKPCVFARPARITPQCVARTITQNIQIPDTGDTKKDSFRNIILVGHSVKEDLKILQYIGLHLFDLAPISIVIDTYLLARYMLPPYSPSVRLQPGQNLSLAGVLSQLGCRPCPSHFHNVGNDAVYTMYAMLLLGIVNTTRRVAQLNSEETRRSELLKVTIVNARQHNMPSINSMYKHCRIQIKRVIARSRFSGEMQKDNSHCVIWESNPGLPDAARMATENFTTKPITLVSWMICREVF